MTVTQEQVQNRVPVIPLTPYFDGDELFVQLDALGLEGKCRLDVYARLEEYFERCKLLLRLFQPSWDSHPPWVARRVRR